MNKVTLFQCIPAYRPKATARVISHLPEKDCKIILDLEDSIQDVNNPGLTSLLKQNARDSFAEILDLLPTREFSIRINSVKTTEFDADIHLLKQYAHRLDSVVIPKVESPCDIARYLQSVSGQLRIHLIIETRKGIQNLTTILESMKGLNTGFIFFGNYDYHLDTGIFPVNEQYSPEYWDTILPVITIVEQYGLSFGNSPYANLADDDTLFFSLLQLIKNCKRSFAMVSLHKEQTNCLLSLIGRNEFSSEIFPDQKEIIFSAEAFQAGRQKGRSFSICDNRIITPHEYLLFRTKNNG